MAATVSLTCISLISTAATFAPSLAKSNAADFPMPDPAPVINATLLASFILLSSHKAQSLKVKTQKVESPHALQIPFISLTPFPLVFTIVRQRGLSNQELVEREKYG